MLVALSGQSATLFQMVLEIDDSQILDITGVAATPELGDLITGLVEFVPTTGVGATSAVGSIALPGDSIVTDLVV